jgi:hypothetical protein
MWHIVKAAAVRAGIRKLAPHDLRRYAESGNMPNVASVWASAGSGAVDDAA